MTDFVISLPGTLRRDLTELGRSRLLGALRGTDPRRVGSDPQDLEVLTEHEGESTFTVRVEVAADDSAEAEREAVLLGLRALKAAGFDEQTVLLGQPVVTAIDIARDGAVERVGDPASSRDLA
ncbi:hypothetical protein GCM10009665_75990 [Kitasatospora nipponensis]|uniref:Uncharacterized protein n=1 Tax=Kitasatospora nipponensis TaxID=258049 RepID=A0ABN1T7M2_9ACTN